MTAIEIRNQIIKKLQNINDISFLEALKTIIDSKTENNEVVYLNKEIVSMLNERIEKIEKGDFIENDDIFKETEKWLKEK